MKWVPTKVNLDDHIIIPEIDPNTPSPDQFLENYAYNLSKTTIATTKPLWDLHLLNLKTSDAEAVGIFRIHHSLGDGTSLMSLLLACTRKLSDPDAPPTIPVKRIGSGSRSGRDGQCWWVGWVWVVLGLVWNTVMDVVRFVATAVFLKDTVTPIKGPPGAEFTPRRFVHRTVSLDDMKLIKNAMNMVSN